MFKIDQEGNFEMTGKIKAIPSKDENSKFIEFRAEVEHDNKTTSDQWGVWDGTFINVPDYLMPFAKKQCARLIKSKNEELFQKKIKAEHDRHLAEVKRLKKLYNQERKERDYWKRAYKYRSTDEERAIYDKIFAWVRVVWPKLQPIEIRWFVDSNTLFIEGDINDEQETTFIRQFFVQCKNYGMYTLGVDVYNPNRRYVTTMQLRQEK